MHIEFLVEEPSVEAALQNVLPKVLPLQTTVLVHPFQGKTDLLKKLPDRLKGYRRWLPDDWRIVVLVDEDRKDCAELKGQMERHARTAGLFTKASARSGTYQLVNRLAVEELEAWFFGDIEAIVSAYPGVPATLGEKAKYRDPDSISGGTWEQLEHVLQQAGYFQGGLAKIEAARAISANMNPDRNRSRSFRVFRDTLVEMVQ